MKRSVSIFTKIYSVIIILLPFLYQYASPLSFLSLGDFIILLFTLYGLLKIDYARAFKCIKPIIVFSASFCVLTGFVSLFSWSYFRYGDALTIFAKILLYVCVCAVSTQYFDLGWVKKIYIVLVRLFALYLFAQVIYHELSGGFLPIYLKHEWLFSWERRPANLVDYYVTGGYLRFRPSSLFLEPGYFAFYVLPALLLLLFEEKKIIEPLLLYCAILLSTSGAGIIIGLLALIAKGFTYIVYFKKGELYVKPFVLVFLLLLAALTAYLAWNSDVLPKLFNSFNSRTLRNLLIFDQTDSVHKIFGVGMNNVENYVNAYKIYTPYDEGNLNFGATLVATVLQYGIIGFVIFAGSLVALVARLKHSRMGVLFIALYIVYIVFEEVIFNFRMGFLMAFVVYYVSRSGQTVCERKAAKDAKQGRGEGERAVW